MAAIDFEQAESAVDSYESENTTTAAVDVDPPAAGGKTYAGVAVAVLLCAFYFVTGTRGQASPWFDGGAAMAEKILHGEWWRTVTALTLHADLAHLISNVVACALFVNAVLRALGVGAGGFAVLLSGAFGNFLNALLHRAHHASVGFSTAIFGAIGILGALEYERRRAGSRRLQAWLAIAASLALLGMLGSDKETDTFAHLFGFIAGGALGLAIARVRTQLVNRALQVTLALSALGVLAGSWLLAGARHFH